MRARRHSVLFRFACLPPLMPRVPTMMMMKDTYIPLSLQPRYNGAFAGKPRGRRHHHAEGTRPGTQK